MSKWKISWNTCLEQYYSILQNARSWAASWAVTSTHLTAIWANQSGFKKSMKCINDNGIVPLQVIVPGLLCNNLNKIHPWLFQIIWKRSTFTMLTSYLQKQLKLCTTHMHRLKTLSFVFYIILFKYIKLTIMLDSKDCL